MQIITNARRDENLAIRVTVEITEEALKYSIAVEIKKEWHVIEFDHKSDIEVDRIALKQFVTALPLSKHDRKEVDATLEAALISSADKAIEILQS